MNSILKLNSYRYEYKMDEPVSISYYTWEYRKNVIVKLTYNGISGYGEAVPSINVTNDTQEEVIKELEPLSALTVNPLKTNFKEFHQILGKTGINSKTLIAGLDFAYHDLIGKLRQKPVYKLYSDKKNCVPNSITVFLKDSLEKTYKETERIIKKYPDLQILKIKLKGERDIERCRMIRKAVPNNIDFILDANQAFNNPKDAVEVLNSLSDILGRIILVEEPCPKNDLEKMKYVKNNLKNNIMVFADESAVDIVDVKRIIETESADGVNIKLQKTQGIWPAEIIAEECLRKGMKIMVGSMIEGPIAAAAGAHFAASLNHAVLTDLDMDLDLKKHTKTNTNFCNGMRIPSELPGLGVELDWNLIEKLKQRNILKFEKI